MNKIYQRADGGQIALYQEGNRVMAAWITLRRSGQPVQQKGDCLGGLTSALFQGSIYFAYENLEHQIVVDILGGGREKIVLTEGADRCKFSGLTLAVKGELLALIYQAWNPIQERFELCSTAPYQPEQSCRIREWEHAAGSVLLLEWENDQYLLTGGDREVIYRWKDAMEWEESRGSGVSWEEEKERLRREWEEEARRRQDQREEEIRLLQAEREAVYREQMEELRKEKDALEEEVRAEAERQKAAREEAFCAWQEQTEQEKKELMRAIADKEEEIRLLKSDQGRAAAADERVLKLKEAYEARLESVRVQYNELAGTAAELQRIGKMWRDKCYQMEGREQ